MSTGVVLVSVAALVSGGWLWWHREAPKTCTGCFLVAGLGIGGGLGRVIAGGLGKVFSPTAGAGTDGGVGPWVSAVVAAVLIAATAEIVIKGMWRRRATPRRWHPWLALVLPTVAIAAGAPLVGPLMTGLAGGVAGIGTAIVTTSSHTTTSHTSTHGRR